MEHACLAPPPQYLHVPAIFSQLYINFLYAVKSLLSNVYAVALIGGSLFFLQQFAGINGVLYYTPQILEQAGVAILLSNLGLSSASASILISSLTTLLMLPSIGLAMRLMDLSGRR